LLRRTVWKKFTDVSEVLPAAVVGVMFDLMMDAAGTSETSVNIY
jgi:hypothetical protein